MRSKSAQGGIAADTIALALVAARSQSAESAVRGKVFNIRRRFADHHAEGVGVGAHEVRQDGLVANPPPVGDQFGEADGLTGQGWVSRLPALSRQILTSGFSKGHHLLCGCQ